MPEAPPEASGLPEQPTRPERAFRWVRANLLRLGGPTAIAALVAREAGYLPALGRPAKLAGISVGAAMLAGYVLADRVIDERWQFRVLLVTVGLEDTDDAGAWWLTKTGIRDLDTEHELFKPTPSLWFARSYDPDEHVARGTWRGTLDDAELLRGLDVVRELRNDLEDSARRGARIQNTLPAVVRDATRKTTRHVVRFFAENELPDTGDGLEAAERAALEDLEPLLEYNDSDDELPEDLDVEQLGPEAVTPDDSPADEPAAVGPDTEAPDD